MSRARAVEPSARSSVRSDDVSLDALDDSEHGAWTDDARRTTDDRDRERVHGYDRSPNARQRGRHRHRRRDHRVRDGARAGAARGARCGCSRRARSAAGATQASAGILAPYIEAHDRGPLFDLTLRSLDAVRRLRRARRRRTPALDVDYRRCGSLEIAADDGGGRRLRAAPLRRPAPSSQWLDRERSPTARARAPDTHPRRALSPTHGYVAVSALTERSAWAALRHGAEIETGATVRTDSTPARTRSTSTADDGTTWTARHGGHRRGKLVGSDSSAPTRGARRCGRFAVSCCGWRGRATRSSHVIWGKDCYVVPWQDGTVLVGATVEDVGFDERTTAAGVRDLLDAVCELLPGSVGRDVPRSARGPASGDARRPADHRAVAQHRRLGLRHRPLPQRRAARAADGGDRGRPDSRRTAGSGAGAHRAGPIPAEAY